MSHQGSDSEREPERGTQEMVLVKESRGACSPHGQSCVCGGGTGVDTGQGEGAAVISEARWGPAQGLTEQAFCSRPEREHKVGGSYLSKGQFSFILAEVCQNISCVRPRELKKLKLSHLPCATRHRETWQETGFPLSHDKQRTSYLAAGRLQGTQCCKGTRVSEQLSPGGPMKGLEKPLPRRGCPRPHPGTKTSRAQVSPLQPTPVPMPVQPQQMTLAGLVGRSGQTP